MARTSELSGRRAKVGEPRERRRCRWRWPALVSLCAAVVLAWLWIMRDPTPRILARHGRLAATFEEPETLEGDLVDQEVRLVSTSGLEVELALRWHADGDGAPRPAVLLMGGHRTGRGAALLVDAPRRAVVVALSYPTEVERIESIGDALDERRAILDTPAAVMLAMDYLAARPDVDAARVELVGVSLGAPFACIAGALEPRFHRVWSIHGGGDPLLLFEHALAADVGFAPARKAVACLICLVGHGFTLAPERWVGRIAPRPFVMVNAEGDERIPRASVELLFAAAGEPKEQVWVPGEHVSGRREDQVRALCELVLERIEKDP